MWQPTSISPRPQYAPSNYRPQPTAMPPTYMQPPTPYSSGNYLANPYNQLPDKYDSGVSRFDSISLRLWGHDLYDDGKNNGSVLLKTLFNPDGSHNEAFLKDAESRRTVAIQLISDIKDDGVINGSSLRYTMGKVYRDTTNHDIMGQLFSTPLEAASLDPAEIMRNLPDFQTADGLRQAPSVTGLSLEQLLAASLWGHDASDQRATGANGPWNIDGSVIAPALNDRNSIDWGFANATPQLKAYTQGLADKDKAIFGTTNGFTLNNDFLGVLGKVYGKPFGTLPPQEWGARANQWPPYGGGGYGGYPQPYPMPAPMPAPYTPPQPMPWW